MAENNTDFFIKKQEAVERMRKMSQKSIPSTPDFVKLKQNKTDDSSPYKKLNIPFLNDLKNDKDVSLILGLALLLFSEKSDKFLMFALLYILM